MIDINQYLVNLNLRKQELQLQLNEVNMQMSNIRARYSQSRSLGSWDDNYMFPRDRDDQLRELQPTKEGLQTEILAIRTEITRVKALKKQGVPMIDTKSPERKFIDPH